MVARFDPWLPINLFFDIPDIISKTRVTYIILHVSLLKVEPIETLCPTILLLVFRAFLLNIMLTKNRVFQSIKNTYQAANVPVKFLQINHE